MKHTKSQNILVLSLLLIIAVAYVSLHAITSRAQASPFLGISMGANPSRVAAGQPANISWSATLYNSSDSLDPSQCSVISSIAGVGVNEINGNATVNPTVETSYYMHMDCTVTTNSSPPSSYDVHADQTVVVNVGTATINIVGSPISPYVGPAGNREDKYCPANTVACGASGTSKDLLSSIICCPLSQEAQNAGIGISGPALWQDSDFGGVASCQNYGNTWAGMGGEWASSNQIDYIFCQSLTGPVELDNATYIEESFASTIMCPSNAVVVGGSTIYKNDAWDGIYCATAYSAAPAATCSIASLNCDANDTLTWQTSNCSSVSFNPSLGSGTLSTSGNKTNVTPAGYTLTATGSNTVTSSVTCPAQSTQPALTATWPDGSKLPKTISGTPGQQIPVSLQFWNSGSGVISVPINCINVNGPLSSTDGYCQAGNYPGN